jgi:hypothetical protein
MVARVARAFPAGVASSDVGSAWDFCVTHDLIAIRHYGEATHNSSYINMFFTFCLQQCEFVLIVS